MKKFVKRTLALIGAICALWIALSGLFFLMLSIVSAFRELKRGHDAWTETAMTFYNLPIWAMVVVVLLAAYAILYIIKNQKMIAGWSDGFFNSITQE